MQSYGQFCPVALAAEIFCERWNAVILREMVSGSTRFSEIQRGAPLMSPSLLTKRLKELEAAGVIERRQAASGRAFEYHLTEAGRDDVPFGPLISTLAPVVDTNGARVNACSITPRTYTVSPGR